MAAGDSTQLEAKGVVSALWKLIKKARQSSGGFLLVTVIGFLFLLVGGARGDAGVVSIGRILHWTGGAGAVITIAMTRTLLRGWRSGFDWILLAPLAVLTLFGWLNGDL
ncbi:hypothetical protein [Streptomyces sp. YIM 130001]|uniref:hypothetical protein n=1 Tax=Streptomyces sp. YIM 130001 TaxID=2259644 RepID=UPI0013C3F6C4|nr:hypothetical protein [Streptomyces sp. YIM 130001]